MSIGIIEKAAALAARGHKEQVRKHGNVPYIVHPFMVSRILTRHGFSDVVIAAGLAHDLLEDTDIGEDEVREELGEEVLLIVKNLSEIQSKDITYKERKQGYIDLVRGGNESVKAVSCADKVHNLTNLLVAYDEHGEDLWGMFSGPKETKIWFEIEVLKMFDDTGFKHSLVEEYRALIKKLEDIT